ncbi:M14 family metallopeptidase [Carboxylicivirga caseinilyticus]|uniref:M14 family metallopeptidase n=1 Tax=Carboxylicivirga caseinilyticus TaxID=3417572 RepID=UPI003D358F22|nr:hypothetical protein [Marinilabiliaceae bacterium A049]
MKNILLVLLVMIGHHIMAQNEQHKIEVPLRFDFYYNYDEVTEALKALHQAYPKLTSLDVVGQSEEGRDIYALTINNEATGKESDKPGIYVDGNIHGNEIQAGEVCLYYANMLLTKYNENERIKKVVDKNVHYIVPVVNVDGRAHFFNDANTMHSSRSLRVPRDDDKDGLLDEDTYDDLDGDGSICQMRIRDPFGKYKTDPEDERLMVRVKPGEKGEWTLLGSEGIDNDGDGRFNEDAEGYLDPNRNWGYRWNPNYIERGSGLYPLSGVGLKALSEYVMKRPNIIMAFMFHNYGGMWLRGPAVKDETLAPVDVKLYDYLGQNAEKMTPGYRYMPSWELYPTTGDYGEFMYNICGAYTFVGELFMGSQETYRKDITKPEEDRDESNREKLKFNDHLGLGELYKPWVKFNHPQYGEIEIGGWVKMSNRLPHPFMLNDLVHRNASVILFAAEQTPEVTMDVFDIQKLDGKLKRVRVRLTNAKGMPSLTGISVKEKLFPQDQLSIKGAKVITGGQITNLLLDDVKYKEYKPEIQFVTVPGFDKKEYEFIVEGSGKITIEYNSVKAGKLSKTIML